jgi:hypothetical protein
VTPDRAAQVLGIGVDASRDVIERAYLRRARETHPDAGGSASAFREATEARDTLLRFDPRPFEYREGPQRQGPLLLSAWVAILLIAAFLSIYGVAHPFGLVEPIIRWGVLIGAALAYGMTGRRGWLVLAIVAVVATAAMTILFASFGGLVALLLVSPAMLGLSLSGISRARSRRSSREW